MGIHHNIIVEPQQVADYQSAVNKFRLSSTIIPLDMEYKNKYQLCDDLGLTKSTGSGPARNFAWDHSIKQGFKKHWVMDDNIRSFRRLHQNMKLKVLTPAPFRIIEDFTNKFLNVVMSGPQYTFFAPRKLKMKPFSINTRIFSCNLIKNDIPFRWRGRYNEDIILSLDILKAGYCTIIFNAILQEKMQTQVLKGGNTDELYAGGLTKDKKYAANGTTDKSEMLCRVHPDVSKMVIKYGRVHHEVDISQYQKNNKLILNPKWLPPKDPNYGLELKCQK